MKALNIKKEVVIISGKGGTGKTTVTSSLSKLIQNKIIVDADVDAADMFILLKPEIIHKELFKGKSVAKIDYDLCTSCGICKQLCRFDAISFNNEKYEINEFLCDGCTLCEISCPVNAIKMKQQTVGEWYISKTDWGDMIHAKLYPGAENSGNLVTMIKVQADRLSREKNISLVIIDGPPGIGCPVTSALSGANYAIIVTEPTMSAIHDMKRALETTTHFNIKTGIVINKFDINEDKTKIIEEFAKENNIEILAKIPFDKCIVDAQINLKTVIEDNKCKHIVKSIEKIKQKIESL